MPRKSTKTTKKEYKPRKQNVRTKTVYIERPIKQKQSRPYKGFLKNAGSTLGSYFGPMGSKVGASIGSLAGKVLGMGSYQIKQNSLFNTSNQIPIMHSVKDSFIIQNREYLGDVIGSTTNYSGTTYLINPGLYSSFPWLSVIANNFEQYCFKGLIYEFKSTCGDAISSSNNSLGTVILSCDYNVTNLPYQNKVQAENSMWAASGKPSQSIILPIECDPKQNTLEHLYIRNGPLQANQNQQFYDLGQIQIATIGMQSAVNIGEIWVSYQISFKKPIVNIPLGINLLGTHLISSTYSNSHCLLGTSSLFNNLNITIDSTGNIIQIPQGVDGAYSIILRWSSSTAVTVSMPSINLGSGLTTVNLYNNDTTWYYNSGSGLSQNTALLQMFVYSNGTNQETITLGSATLPAGNLDIIVSQIPSTII